MTEREKIAHVFRRLGLGATKTELDQFEKLGLQAAIDHLIDAPGVDEGFPVSPWEFCFEEGKEEMYLDSYRPAAWWALRMFMTRRPFQEKLTLFWHNHFAVSGAKVELGPMMLSYYETLRTFGGLKFRDLLKMVTVNPAMIRWLDTDASSKAHPNENFARELMELFTLGIGNYTEKDVQEAARTFTGLGIRYLIIEAGGEHIQERAKEAVEKNEPMVVFCVAPELHDEASKTILGRTSRFENFELLDMLADHPATARYVGAKLWSFFAYPSPEKEVVDRIEAIWKASDGNVKAIVREMVKMPEFWSEKCVRRQVKSPVDFVVPILRQFELQDVVRGLRSKDAKPTRPLDKPLRDTSGLIVGSLYQQGMLLLFPPDVSGWKWGEAWITSNNMGERMKFASLIFGVGQPDQPLAAFLGQQILTKFKPKNAAETASALVEIFDASLPPEKVATLAQAVEKAGGPAALSNKQSASNLLASTCKLLFGCPEFQLC